MLDAYTVGITLALNNGVSEGLAAVRRDLSGLDQAIDTSATALIHLRELAKVMNVSASTLRLTDISSGQANSPDVVARQGPASEHLRETEPMETSLPGMTRFLADDGRPPAAGGSGTVVAMETPSAPKAWQSAPPQAPPSLMYQPQPAPLSMVPVDVGQEAALDAPDLPVADRSHQTVHFDLSRSVTPLPDGPQSAIKPGETAAHPSVSVRPVRAFPVSGEDGITGAASPVGDWGSATVAATIPSSGSTITPLRSSPELPLAPRPDLATRGAAPQGGLTDPAPAAPTGALLSSYATAISPERQAAAPQEPESRAGSLQGDVYLDGTRLGRWIVDHLSREADRPPAGTTNFDPRMNVTWPGAPIGN